MSADPIKGVADGTYGADAPLLAACSGRVQLADGYSVEIEAREAEPGLMRLEINWHPRTPPARLMDRLCSSPAYINGVMAICAAIDRRLNAK